MEPGYPNCQHTVGRLSQLPGVLRDMKAGRVFFRSTRLNSLPECLDSFLRRQFWCKPKVGTSTQEVIVGTSTQEVIFWGGFKRESKRKAHHFGETGQKRVFSGTLVPFPAESTPRLVLSDRLPFSAN